MKTKATSCHHSGTAHGRFDPFATPTGNLAKRQQATRRATRWGGCRAGRATTTGLSDSSPTGGRARRPTSGGATASVFLTPPNFIPAWPVTTHLCAGNGRNDPNASAVAYLHEKGIAAPRGCAPSLYACLFHDTEAALHSRRRTAPPECADPCAEILSPALDVAPDSSERASWAVRRPDS